MIRRALTCLLVAVPVLAATVPALAANPTGAPGAAVLQATSASNGVRLIWQGPASGDAPTSYAIFRGTSAGAMTKLATTPSLSSYADKLSATTAPSTTYLYKVQGLNSLGGSPFSNVVSASTPASVRVPTATKAVVVDEGTATHRVTDGEWQVAAGSPTYVSLIVHAKDGWSTQISAYAPNGQSLVGTYPVQPSRDDTHATVNLDGCPQATGTVTVHDLAADADGNAVVVDLDADLTCGTRKASAVVRLGTDSAYPFVNVPDVNGGGQIPDVPHAVQSTYANEGNTPVTISQVAVTGDAWAVGDDNTCTDATLAPGQSCHVGLTVTPALGLNPGTITYTDTTGAGSHTRALAASGVTAPVKPVINSFARTGGKLTIGWADPGTVEQRATTFRVLRGPDADHLTLLRAVEADSFTDPDTADGLRVYAIESVNGAGTARSDAREADLAFRAPTALTGAASVSKTELSWTAPTGTPPNERTGYAIFRGTSATALTQVASTPYPTWSGPAPAAGTHSFFQVAAVLQNGAIGPHSNTVDLASSASQLIIGQAGRVAAVPVSGGPGVSLVDNSGFLNPDVAVSPNGTWVAYTTTQPITSGTSPRQLWMQKTDGSTGPVPVANTTADEYSPSWSPDGRQIAYSRDDGSTLTICRTAVTNAGGGACTPITQDGYDDPSWVNATTLIADDFSADSAPLVLLTTAGDAFPVEGTDGGYLPSVSPDGTQVAFLSAGATDFSEVIRVLDLTTGAVRTLPAPGGMLFSLPSWTRDQSALYVVGGTDTSSVYRIPTGAGAVTTVDNNPGDHFAVAVSTPDLTAPVNVKLGGVPAVTLGASVTPTFSASDALNKIASYSLSYRRAAYNGGYSAPTVKVLTKATAIAVTKGYSYCFSVRATDRAGNTSAATPEQCVMVPLDDRSLARSSGFAPVANRAYYAGTAMKATGRGQTLTRTGMTALRQLTVIATACPTCGTADVLVGGHKVGAVNLYSRTAVNRKVFTLPAFSVRSGTVQLKVTSTGKTVVVDGLGFRK